MSEDPMFKLENIGVASVNSNETTSNVVVEGKNIENFSATNNKSGVVREKEKRNIKQIIMDNIITIIVGIIIIVSAALILGLIGI